MCQVPGTRLGPFRRPHHRMGCQVLLRVKHSNLQINPKPIRKTILSLRRRRKLASSVSLSLRRSPTSGEASGRREDLHPRLAPGKGARSQRPGVHPAAAATEGSHVPCAEPTPGLEAFCVKHRGWDTGQKRSEGPTAPSQRARPPRPAAGPPASDGPPCCRSADRPGPPRPRAHRPQESSWEGKRASEAEGTVTHLVREWGAARRSSAAAAWWPCGWGAPKSCSGPG